ncbi:MAG: CarD family transcriptional regulator [Alphaproteobacteria bacterium]|nr:CarD family transcriptional regulator [Alphaproteobacteria bacterium]
MRNARSNKPKNTKMPANKNSARKSSVNKTVNKPLTAKAVATKPVPANAPLKAPQQKTAPKMAEKVKVAKVADNDNRDFAKGDFVVYPAHGVGQIEGVETHVIGGMQVSLYAIAFEKDRMRVKIPVMKAKTSGLRRLSTGNRLQDAIKTLKGRARIRRTMWSRRAQEYETKINSGDPISIAEVLRDLKRSNDDTEQSYSERQIYQSALQRLAREVAAVEKITEAKATERLEGLLTKAAAKNKAA